MADSSFVFNINDFAAGRLVAINGYKWTCNDLHDEASGRTMDGIMHVYIIGDKVQLDITCIPMVKSDAQALLAALSAMPEFAVEYEDPRNEEPRTATFYCASRNCEYLGRIRGQKWWKHIKFTLTEC